MPCQCGVGPMVVVPVQPAGKQAGALGVAAVEANVGPLVQEGPVVALDLAVGLRTSNADEALLDAELLGGLPKGVGVAVGLGVVGQQPFDGDAVAGEELDGA